MFIKICEQIGMSGCVEEYKFHPTRKWRIDYAFPDIKLAIEIEGGIWLSKYGKKSRHFYGKGALCDMEKYSKAAELGWRLLRYPSLDEVNYDQVRNAFNYRECHIKTQKNEENIIKNILPNGARKIEKTA